MLDKEKVLQYLNTQVDISDVAYTKALHKGDVVDSALQQAAMLIYVGLVNRVEAGEFDKR